jgi:hypothetical protein
MKRLRKVGLVALLFALCVGFALWLFSARLTERLRVTVARELASALSTDAELGTLSVALSPLGVTVQSVALGPNGEWLRAKDLKVRLLPYASFQQRRPVVEVEGDGVWIDVKGLTGAKPKETETSEKEGAAPAFRVQRLRLTNARARIPIDAQPLDLTVASLTGEIESSQEARIALKAGGEGVHLERQEGRLDLDRVVLDGGWTKHGLVVRDLEVHGDGIEIAGAEETGDETRHRVHGDIELARVAGFDESLHGLEGHLRLVAVLSGALEDPGIDASLSAGGLHLRSEEIGNLRARVTRRGDRVEIQRARREDSAARREARGRSRSAASGSSSCERNGAASMRDRSPLWPEPATYRRSGSSAKPTSPVS